MFCPNALPFHMLVRRRHSTSSRIRGLPDPRKIAIMLPLCLGIGLGVKKYKIGQEYTKALRYFNESTIQCNAQVAAILDNCIPTTVNPHSFLF